MRNENINESKLVNKTYSELFLKVIESGSPEYATNGLVSHETCRLYMDINNLDIWQSIVLNKGE